MNLVEFIKDQLPAGLSDPLGSLIGAGEGVSRSAIDAAVPALLSALSSVVSTGSGAKKLASALGQFGGVSMDNLAEKLATKPDSMLEQGTSLLSSLFGGGTVSAIVNALSRFASLAPGAAQKLLGYLAPMVLGAIAGRFAGKSVTTQALSNLFADQKANIANAMPSGFSLTDVPGLGVAGAEHERELPVAATTTRETDEAPRREVAHQAPRRETYEAPRRETHEAPRHESYEAPRRETYEAPRRETYEAPRRETYEAPRRETYEAPRRPVETIPQRDDSSWFWWALPLIGLALLGAYATRACAPVREPRAYTPPVIQRQEPRVARPTEPAPASVERREAAVPPAPVQTAFPPRLVIERSDDGRVRVSGIVADEATRRSIIAALDDAFGGGKVVSDIGLDSRVAPANWGARLLDLARLLAGNPRAAVTMEGNKVTLGGPISATDKQSLIDGIRNILGSSFAIE
jgi:hypothetical protein